MSYGDIDLEPDDLVARLIPDYNTPPDVVPLVGFLGEGSPGHRRIYANPDLKSWLEIKDEDIVARQRIPAEQGMLGGRSALWVKGDAMRAPLFQEPTEELQAKFLTGPLTSGARLPATRWQLAEQLTLINTMLCPDAGIPTIIWPCDRLAAQD